MKMKNRNSRKLIAGICLNRFFDKYRAVHDGSWSNINHIAIKSQGMEKGKF